MDYMLSGTFIEACDCTVICPCWVDDDPVGGHCTGFIAWTLGKDSQIEGMNASGCTVVSVSTHAGVRKNGDATTTVLYIDIPEDKLQQNNTGVFEELAKAFSGDCEGPLKDLAQVSGTVAGCERALIHIGEPEEGPKGKWTVTVRPLPLPDLAGKDDPDTVLVCADGQPQIFDSEHGGQDPLVLRHTALSHELGVPDDAQDVVAQQGGTLRVYVGALPGGNLEVTKRSGMRGSFKYQLEKASGQSTPGRMK